MTDDLLAQWVSDATALAPGTDPEPFGVALLRRWGEAHRHYHSTQHLTEVLAALQDLESGGAVTPYDGMLARVAAWFHDAVYDPAAPADNEAHSARLAVSALSSLGVAPDAIATVERLVRASERHLLPAEGGAEAAFHDADLWILGAPVERFDDYCAQVRREFAAVPEAAYAEGRTAVLRPLPDRDRLYATDLAHRAWTPRARANLTRELGRPG